MEERLYLTELISAETLQHIQDAFSAMTGMAALTTDSDGVPVTNGSNFSDFCMKHMRESEDGHIRCEQCDKFGAEDSWRRGSSTSYYCHAGLIDYAAPILAEGQMVGSFIGGQVLTEPPQKDKIYMLAWELGVDSQELWEAAQKIRILDKQVIVDAAQFLFTVANVLSDMAYGKYRMLQASQEIERANSMKSDFLANMSHEIRTPMNAVIGMAEMALREDLTPVARNYIRQIKTSSRALLTIINDILDFSKIESGKMDIVPVEYEPMSMVNDIANIALERLKDKDVELILDISPDIPHRLMGDNIRIKQILLNLVNNATKFTNTGQVVVRMSHIYKTDKTTLLHFAVEDTGIGIRTKDLETIFNSFQQVDSKRNRNIEGTGLGLAISRQLTQLMEGNIRVESEYGKGTTFSFELPQGVVDQTPSSRIREPESIQAASLLKNSYLKYSMMVDLKRFHIAYSEAGSVGDIEFEEGKTHYLFVEEELFDSDIEAFVRENPDITAVLLLDFRSTPDNYNLPNLYIVRKPLYSMNEAMIFNREGLQLQEEDDDSVNINFVAPKADVLIVDDNAINLTVAEGLLEPLRMRVDTAGSGKEAVEKIKEKKYDIIFMDHMMPDMDGVETTHVIRRFHPDYNDIPIIALTANAMSGTREMFLREGMNDFVSKPIELKTLIKKVAHWLPDEKIQPVENSDDAVTKKESQEVVVGDLDTKTAIRLLGGEKLFWSVLKDYYRVIKQKADCIEEMEKKEDWKAYTIEVHALKSSSRQIGAMSLAEQAADMESAGNEKDAARIHECTGPMLEKYRAYLPVLAPFCEEEEIRGDRERISEDKLADFFAELREAVDELDMDRMEEVSGAMKEFSYEEGQQPLFERLLDAVDNIDVDACEEIMLEWEKAAGLSK